MGKSKKKKKKGSSHTTMVSWFLTMVPRPYSGERFQQVMLGQLDSHMQENKVGPIPHHMQKLTQNGSKI